MSVNADKAQSIGKRLQIPSIEGADGINRRDKSRHRHANRITQTAKRDIWDIGAPHTGPIGLTRPWGRRTAARKPPQRVANSASSKIQKSTLISII